MKYDLIRISVRHMILKIAPSLKNASNNGAIFGVYLTLMA